MCKVQGCTQSHSKHYCRVCQSSDSSHFASSCPYCIQVFHGTSEEFASKIKQNGWKLTSQEKGRIGEGVYFATDFEVAKKIAIGKYGQDYWAVLQCRIPFFYQSQQKEKKDELAVGLASSLGMGGGILLASNPIGWGIMAGSAVGILASLASLKKKNQHNQKILNQKEKKFQKQTHGPWENCVEHCFEQIVVRKNKVHNIKIVKIWK